MERTNAGYTIIKAVKIENEEIVLGRNKDEKYVTWRCETDYNYYYWGHYFETLENAMIDFYERVKNEAIQYRGVWERKKIEKERKENANNEA